MAGLSDYSIGEINQIDDNTSMADADDFDMADINSDNKDDSFETGDTGSIIKSDSAAEEANSDVK